MLIPINSIVFNPHSFRKKFNQEAIDELAENISHNGLIQPITVRKTELDTYIVVVGDRRLKACKKLGWTEIPCQVIEPTEEEMLFISLSENLQREDLGEVEKAEGVYRLQLSTRYSTYKLAEKLGKSQKYISLLLQLLNLPIEVKEMVKADEVSAKNVRPLSQLESTQEQVKVAEFIRDQDLSYSQANETVKFIKEMPEPIREKLQMEPQYTVEDAIGEAVMPEVCMANEVLKQRRHSMR